MKQIEINEFKLIYNGFLNIEFEYKGEKISDVVDLDFIKLFQILKNENINAMSLNEELYEINAKNTTLLLPIIEDEDNQSISFVTSENLDYFDSGFLACEIKK